MNFPDIITGELFEYTLKKLKLSPEQEEELHEAVTWTLAKKPDAGLAVHTEIVTLFYLRYLTRSKKFALVIYRFDKDAIILEEVHWDLSDGF
jgi:hypothetical protein